MKAAILSLTLGLAGGLAASSLLFCSSLVFIAVSVAQEPASPIHHAPKRPTFQWASDGMCDWPANDCRIAAMGGTR